MGSRSWFDVSHTFLLFLAAAIWAAGAVACADVSSKLLTGVSLRELYITLGVALTGGLLLGATIFRRLADLNVSRIETLNAPKLWEAYRARFYAFLVVIDGGSVLLTHFYAKDTTSKLVLGGIDLAICIALSISWPVYCYRFMTDFGDRSGVGFESLLLQEDNSRTAGGGASARTSTTALIV